MAWNGNWRHRDEGSRRQRSRHVRLAAIAAFGFFLIFGSMRQQAGIAAGYGIRIAALWSRLTYVLEVRGLPGPVVALVWVSAGIALLAAVLAFWVAPMVHDEDDSEADLPLGSGDRQ